jgi:hypothetical protein
MVERQHRGTNVGSLEYPLPTLEIRVIRGVREIAIVQVVLSPPAHELLEDGRVL